MKAKILFVTTLATAVAFVSCNKEVAPVVETGTKTVKVDVSGVFAGTRSNDTDAIGENKPVHVNNIEVYLSDKTSFYQEYDQNGEPVTTVYNYNDWSNLNASWTKSYHFVPAAVNEVIVVGNTGATDKKTYSDPSILRATTLNIEDEQDCTALSLYGEDIQLATGTPDEHAYPNYDADVTIKPHVSRLEINSFQYTGTTYKAKDMKLMMVFFNNYHTTANLATGVVGNTKVTVSVDRTNVFTTLQEVLTAKENNYGTWSYDNNETGWAFAANSEGTAEVYDPEKPFSYNFFTTSATVTPQVIVWLQAKNTDGDIQNLYLKTKLFHKEGSTDNAISASTNQVYTTDFIFDDDNLENPEKCIDLTVSVVEWEIVPVITDFEE